MIRADVAKQYVPSALLPLARRLRRLPSDLRWLAVDFRHSPGLELYSSWRNRENGAFFLKTREWAAAGIDPYLEPYHPRAIPKIVWTHWAQGEAAAPPVVRRCIDSWRRLNPGWEVRVLDDVSAAALVDTSAVPGILPYRCHTNVIKLGLLRRFGGVWADATSLCHRPLDDWLPLQAASGFFVFGEAGPGRSFDNWFIASEPDGILISAWDEAYARYITRCTRLSRKYFMMIWALEWRLRREPALRAAWARTARLPTPPCFVLMSALQGVTAPEVVHAALSAGLPVSKLSWRFHIPDDELSRRLKELLAG